MDVFRPQLVWLGGRCYRNYRRDVVTTTPVHPEEEEVNTEPIICEDEPCDSEFDIEKLSNGQFKTTMALPREYYGNIVGASGSVRKRIELETKAIIKVPRTNEKGDIIIIGNSKAIVSSARTRIEVIVDSARQKQPFTHFISIPMNSLKHSFLDFRDSVLRECGGARRLDKTLFQNPDKLHLTIGTMPLLDKSERDKAVNLLSDCEKIIPSILKNKPLQLKVHGLEYMNDDPSEVDVLYAKITPNESGDRLQLLADYIVKKFVSEGIMQRQNERVKLHVTVMNSLFRKDDSGELGIVQKQRKGQRESFDATKTLKLFENYHFGEVEVKSLHLSQRYSNDRYGYYVPAAVLKFT